MTIHLSGQREQLILSLLQAGKFTSADEVIDEALRLVEVETGNALSRCRHRRFCMNVARHDR